MLPELEVGAVADVPAKLCQRLARLHLVDSARGQTPAFRAENVRRAEWQFETVAVDEERVRLVIRGDTECAGTRRRRAPQDGTREASHERGVRTRLVGRAIWDRARERFVEFEMLAIGERWGASQYNERDEAKRPTAIGFAFVLAPPDHPRVAPAYWWQYRL